MNPHLQDIYDKIPDLKCKCLCHKACGMVPAHPLEVAEIEAFTGRRVKLHDTNWGMSYENCVVLKPHPGSLTCRYLRRGKCSIYEVRPLVCRLYGVAIGLECEHGCMPAQRLGRNKAHELIAELNALEIPDARPKHRTRKASAKRIRRRSSRTDRR